MKEHSTWNSHRWPTLTLTGGRPSVSGPAVLCEKSGSYFETSDTHWKPGQKRTNFADRCLAVIMVVPAGVVGTGAGCCMATVPCNIVHRSRFIALFRNRNSRWSHISQQGNKRLAENISRNNATQCDLSVSQRTGNIASNFCNHRWRRATLRCLLGKHVYWVKCCHHTAN